MVRRIIYFTFLFTLVGAIAYFYLSYQKKSNHVVSVHPFAAIPTDASFIIQVNKLSQCAQTFKVQNDVINVIKQVPVLKTGIQFIALMDSLVNLSPELDDVFKSCSFSVSWHAVGPSRVVPLITWCAPDNNSAELVADELAKYTILNEDIKKYDKVRITPVLLKPWLNQKAFFFVKDNFVVLSTEALLLEKSIGELNLGGTLPNDTDFNKIYQTAGKNSCANLYLNLTNLAKISKVWGASAQRKLFDSFGGIGSWVEMDLKIEENAVMFNGFGIDHNLNDYYSCLKTQTPIKFTAQEVLPASVKSFVLLGFSDIAKYRSSYNAYVHSNMDIKKHESQLNDFYNNTGVKVSDFFDGLLDDQLCAISDAGLLSANSFDCLYVVHVKSQRDAEQKYDDFLTAYAEKVKEPASSFSSEISVGGNFSCKSYAFPFKNALGLLYGKFIDEENLSRVCFYNNYMIIGANDKVLHAFLLENMRNSTLANDPQYLAFYSNMSENSNVFWYLNMSKWKDFISQYFNDSYHDDILGKDESWKKFYATGMQLTSLNNLVYHNLYLHFDPQADQKPRTVWESGLDSTIITKPVLMLNHYTKEREICVQDALNNLYLLNKSGIVIWKKKLEAPILGTINQIDYYKNGKLQYLFNTNEKIHLLDRDGNFVERYPVNLPANATNGLSVFDYENNKDYRIFIPCDNRKVYLFGKDGNINKGWKFPGSDHLIQGSIQYFRYGNRDFIVCKDKSRLYILDRKGNTRIKIKNQFQTSENNEVYFDSNEAEGKPRFVTTSIDGTIKYIYLDGTVKESLFIPCSASHYYVFADIDGDNVAEHLFVNEEKLQVLQSDGKEMFSHDFHTPITIKPNIYRFSSNNYKIGITDSNNQQIYLFSANGEVYKGFPLNGQTEFTIGFLASSDYTFSLLVGGRNSFLLNYMVK